MDDEEAQLQRVLEESAREYEVQQRSRLDLLVPGNTPEAGAAAAGEQPPGSVNVGGDLVLTAEELRLMQQHEDQADDLRREEDEAMQEALLQTQFDGVTPPAGADAGVAGPSPEFAGPARLSDLFAEVSNDPGCAPAAALDSDQAPEPRRGEQTPNSTRPAAKDPGLLFQLLEDDVVAAAADQDAAPALQHPQESSPHPPSPPLPAASLATASAKKPEAAARPLQSEHALYNLQSVIHHKGLSTVHGHYIADAKALKPLAQRGTSAEAAPPSPAWFTFDDSYVSQCRLRKVQQSALHDGYLYVFVHSAIPWQEL